MLVQQRYGKESEAALEAHLSYFPGSERLWWSFFLRWHFMNVSLEGMNNFHLLSSHNGECRQEWSQSSGSWEKLCVLFTLAMSDFQSLQWFNIPTDIHLDIPLTSASKWEFCSLRQSQKLDTAFQSPAASMHEVDCLQLFTSFSGQSSASKHK